MSKVFFALFLFLLCISSSAKESNDYEYNVAMAYINGTKGETKTKKVIPKCPYDRCKGLTKEITVVKKDYKKALYWLNRSLEQGYVPAAQKAYELLYKQVDYKQSTPNKYLVLLMKKRFGLELKDYYRLIKRYVKAMKKSNTCGANYYIYDIYKHGYFNINKNIKIKKEYQKRVLKTCPKNSFWAMSATRPFKIPCQ